MNSLPEKELKIQLFFIYFPLFLPCENQTKYWKQQDIDVYNDIKLRADKVKVLASHYYNGCMQKKQTPC